MNCAIAQEMLGPFFDDELDVNSGLQLRLHLSGCDGCTVALARLHSRRDMIRNSQLTYQAPPDLEARIRKSIHADGRTASNWRIWGALAAAILVACTLSIDLLQQRASRSAQLDDQVISSHIRAMMTGHTTDVISTDRHTVKPWFNGRTDFSPPVSDLALQGFPLAGGRVDYLAGRSVATLVYHRRKHVIDLFIRPVGSGEVTGDESSKGYNVIRWKAGGMFYIAVSDLNKMELEQFKNLLLKP